VKVVFAVPTVMLPVGDSVNQVLPAQLCSEVAAVALVLLCADAVKVCDAGAVPPATPLKVSAEALNVSGFDDDPAVTVSVTL
jgi:hypothetical protein